MRKAVTAAAFVVGIVVSAMSLGQPATYQDDVLLIPQAAVVGDEPVYFVDIELTNDGSDKFILTAAQARSLVSVNTVTVNILESFPLQVTVSVAGTKSVPCVELLTPAVARQGNVFNIVLAESQLGPAESCIAVIDPFETSIPLAVAGLSAGSYVVRVNGVEVQFVLDTDN